MVRSDDDQPSAAVPEADRLEQEQAADPAVADDQPWPAAPTGAADDADDADRLEQAHDVLGDPDEEYTPDPP